MRREPSRSTSQGAERKVRKSRAGRQSGDRPANLLTWNTLKATGRGYRVSEDLGWERHKWVASGNRRQGEKGENLEET